MLSIDFLFDNLPLRNFPKQFPLYFPERLNRFQHRSPHIRCLLIQLPIPRSSTKWQPLDLLECLFEVIANLNEITGHTELIRQIFGRDCGLLWHLINNLLILLSDLPQFLLQKIRIYFPVLLDLLIGLSQIGLILFLLVLLQFLIFLLDRHIQINPPPFIPLVMIEAIRSFYDLLGLLRTGVHKVLVLAIPDALLGDVGVQMMVVWVVELGVRLAGVFW